MKSTRGLFRLLVSLFLALTITVGSRAAGPGDPITNLVQFFATLVYGPLTFIGNPPVFNAVDWQARLFKVGPFNGDENDVVGSVSADKNGESVLAVYSGKLTLNLPSGEKFEVSGGQGAVFDKDGKPKGSAQSLSTLMANPAYNALLMNAAKEAASQLAANTDTTKTAELTRALAAVVQTLSAADPTAAQEIVTATVNELTKGGKDDEATLKSISTVIAAAANGSKTDKETLTNAALGAAAKNNATGVTTTALADANIQKALGGVFGSDTSSEAIDITIPVVSPSSP